MHSAGKTNGDGDDSDDGADDDEIGKKMRWRRQRSIHRLRSNNTQGG